MSGVIKCPECRGSGKVAGGNCKRCNGKGEVTCAKCNGKGVYPCPDCQGNGVVGNSNSSSNSSNNNSGHNNNNNVGNDSHSPHKFPCPVCKGDKEVPVPCPNPDCHNGAVYCEECNYTGYIQHKCDVCNGEGTVSEHRKIPCTKCKGEKFVEEIRQEKCTHCRDGKVPRKSRGKFQQDKTVYVDCSYCNGTGMVLVKYKVPCDACRRNGYKIEREPTTVKCEACKGQGYIKEKCKKCDGKGCYPCPTCKGYANIREKCSRCKGYGVIYTN